MGSIIAAIALLVGWAVVATYSALHHIERVGRANPVLAAENLVWLTRIVAFGFSIGILTLGAWIVWLGHRICRRGHFPLSGLMLIRPVRPVTGRRARVLGWGAQVLGVVILILGTMATWLFVELAQMLLRA